MERFGRLLGRAWWHLSWHVPARVTVGLDLALERVPGFLQGTHMAYSRSLNRRLDG